MGTKNNSNVSFDKICVGFFTAIFASSICLFLFFLIGALHGRLNDGIFFPISATLYIALTDFFLLPLVGVAVFLFAGIPSAAFVWFAYRFRIGSLIFFLSAGGVVALICGATTWLVTKDISWYSDPIGQQPLGMWKSIFYTIRYDGPAGFLGGFAFWLKVGKYFRG